MKAKQILLYLIIMVLVSCKPEEQPPVVSYVFSDVLVDAKQTSATITCRNESVDDDKVFASVLLSKNENITNATKYPLSLQNDTLHCTINGLERNTMYFFCFEVSTANEHKRTDEVHHFETTGGGNVTVTTSEAINITQNGATGGGSVTADANYEVSMRGVCWDTVTNPNALVSPHLVSGQGTGTFLVNITGLNSHTTYYMKAYAVCNDVVYYGNEVSFTTLQMSSYMINVSTSPTDGGTVVGGGIYQQGQSCTVTAIANEGYTFTNWTENGIQVSDDVEFTFVVSGNRNLVANFTATIPPNHGEVQSLPYSQSFATDFGTYMTYDEEGPQFWEIKYSTARINGYVNGSYYANEDWLISSPVAIMGVDHAKMTIVYIGRYFSNINDEVTIWVSTNYTWGSDPSMTSWTQVPSILVEGSNWNDFITTEISLSEYVGQTVTFAVKYISTGSEAGDLEVQSICIEEGSGEVPPTPPTPGDGEGSGTFEDPYNVAAGISQQSNEPIAWVHGYIVGAVKSGLSSVTSNADINWSAPFDLATNVVIADDVTCREISQCIIVNLPAGKPLRTQVNLMDNPDNLGKHLAVNGKLRKYMNQAGLRDSGGTEADFVLEGGVIPPTPGTEIFSESFASGQGEFTIQDAFLPQDLSYVWQHDANYSCMKASAYVGQAYAAESWLISPAIDLSNVSTAMLKFDQAVNYASPSGALSVMVSTDYAGEVLQCNWTELNLSQWPAGTNWTFINSTADLSQFVGQRVTIAFKYTSNTNASATWEVKDFVVED